MSSHGTADGCSQFVYSFARAVVLCVVCCYVQRINKNFSLNKTTTYGWLAPSVVNVIHEARAPPTPPLVS